MLHLVSIISLRDMANLSAIYIILCGLIHIIIGINVVKNYCNPNLCGTTRNSACNNTGKFSSGCPAGIKLFTFSDIQKQLMLDTLNICRSNISVGSANNAAGEVFPPAKQMSKLQWDVEQEFMSSLQVKTCASHDPCKNTWYNSSYFNIPVFAGQNIYYESTYAPNRPPLERSIVNAVYAWYNEVIVAPIDVADAVHAVPGREIGHFLTMSHDLTQRVGCTGSQYERAPDQSGINKYTQITCNFFKAPFLTLPLYQTGDICSGCADCDQNEDTYGLCIIDPSSFANTYYNV